ncbi:flagellum-specific ATP synthase FliI [Bacillus sp. JCM 19045]|uniref:Flagellum-specific ATP synthase n=1 Tax=Shouchella xiaoxiensis TaxID=766895 RepID=A0ABS2SQW6_9BACI|nr:flagellar protein export ATPase FliI [Shouchella xiaoxiensis]MBM7837650.1 flagellum-specific ATP synthase [Shouchella xiaoxiensis]GAF12881.1 flagellum-specific ATP synthase FliI [Bacillus sp. JCM 19045]
MRTQLIDEVTKLNPYKWYGLVKQVTGLTIESAGPKVFIGELCFIWSKRDGQTSRIRAEVVGFREDRVLLMPLDTLLQIEAGSVVEATGKPLSVPVGPHLIGQVLDGTGELLDPAKKMDSRVQSYYSTDQMPPNPLERPRITEIMSVGVKVIDGLLTMGKGQRVGIFAGSGVGKSTLMSMIAKQSEAELNVIALVGERGREVKEFIERDLGESGLKRSIVVVATSDQPALLRVKGALTATAIAEYFRDQGYSVNLMMDSVTRFAMAQREIGLAIGEPPTTKGYPPSVFAMLPKLLERSGTSNHGTITAFYTVLVDGDDLNEPIADAVRGILDGHFVLDRNLANKGQFPAVNVLKSVSRLMKDLVANEHAQMASLVRKRLADYEESEDLIQIGAYKKGNSSSIDAAIHMNPIIVDFLKQRTDVWQTYEQTVNQMKHFLEGNDLTK